MEGNFVPFKTRLNVIIKLQQHKISAKAKKSGNLEKIFIIELQCMQRAR